MSPPLVSMALSLVAASQIPNIRTKPDQPLTYSSLAPFDIDHFVATWPQGQWGGLGGGINPAHDRDCDWNYSGVIDTQDLFDFISDFFANVADFNHDGVTDQNDWNAFQSCFEDTPNP